MNKQNSFDLIFVFFLNKSAFIGFLNKFPDFDRIFLSNTESVSAD